MALSPAQLRASREDFVRELRDTLADLACKFTKAELEAAAQAVDGWAETNAAGYNSALPQPFRGTASAPEKAVMLAIVAIRRTGR